MQQVYRRADEDDVDNIGLFIISDTSQRNDNLFSFPLKNRAGWLSLRGVVGAAWLLFILALVASISLVVNLFEALQTNNLGPLRAIFLYIIPLIFSLSIVVLIVLTSSVFKKRVRDLGFKDINVYARYRGKLISNLIYSLNDATRFGDAIRMRKLEPSAELQSIATDAEAVPTNLWFTEEAALRKLIVCGQASICFNLMKHMLEQKSSELQDLLTPEFHRYTQPLSSSGKFLRRNRRDSCAPRNVTISYLESRSPSRWAVGADRYRLILDVSAG